ncbi:hypothetical protein BDR07DRAFT_32002 [Suillus spraguei]|nr:hypothetical protein BDR07DRAFT_32002 [Suillus spraguei]
MMLPKRVTQMVLARTAGAKGFIKRPEPYGKATLLTWICGKYRYLRSWTLRNSILPTIATEFTTVLGRRRRVLWGSLQGQEGKLKKMFAGSNSDTCNCLCIGYCQ